MIGALKTAVLLALAVSVNAQPPLTWAELAEQADALGLPSPRLDFVAVYQHRLVPKARAEQLERLQAVQQTTSQFEPQTWCEARALDALKFKLETQALRLHLMTDETSVAYPGSIHALSQGDLWYRYLTRWWLGAAVSADDLFHMGETTFEQAIVAMRGLPTNTSEAPKIPSQDDAAIQAEFKASAAHVKGNWHHQFNAFPGLTEPKVARSPLGRGFTAPGHYGNDTVYYNPLQDPYDVAQVDWLSIHEGVPGHHLQQQMRRLHPLCAEVQSAQPQMAFIEGWAAYVETLGHELGWYRSQSSQAYAYRWAAIRAMRVMIDVGIHARGWSDAQARTHWQRHFPEGVDVMEREIQRIKRWPMQVITYVYGMNQIKQLKSQLSTKPGFDVRTFHNNLLRLSHLPVQALDHLSTIKPETHHE